MRSLISSKKRITLTLSLMFFGLMVLVAFVHEDGVLSVFKMDRKLMHMRAENENIRQELDHLRLAVKQLKTDPTAVEKISREKLSMVRPGEKVYRIVRKSGYNSP
tara:strand:+ start:728 stop:1042 length:315 start_codon:yes stop_codon:yes gene_type:complete